MKAIFVVVALLVAFASATPPPECPNDEEEDVILFPNPDDCSSYYSCIRDTPVLMQCNEGLEFNPQLRVCDWPKKNATCKRRSTRPPHPPHTSTTPEGSTPKGTTPEWQSTQE
ncbi:peritrophin-1-like isoform X3 [Bombus pascuorum]|uniref:peritrophin-1-like isoform X2 n=1 Tax=Bombus pascuorum TaxID=65598 RepID=UPI00298E7A29|nr:peritrophin-1-like isoform X2 [Bombus pascuorum]XP_060822425.1 peritrophin-1-like isoform X3 [Bombus pascuorum]